MKSLKGPVRPVKSENSRQEFFLITLQDGAILGALRCTPEEPQIKERRRLDAAGLFLIPCGPELAERYLPAGAALAVETSQGVLF